MIRYAVALIPLLMTTGVLAVTEWQVPRDLGVAPEIAPSVQFGADVPAISLQDLHGKLVVVVFFQSWCPLCDEWSPRVFKELQDLAGNRRDVVLVAAKSDGGGVPAALAYLKAKTDTSKWLVGNDAGAVWEIAATGTDALYQYMIVGPDGTMIDGGSAGIWWQEGNSKLQTPAFYLKKLLKVTQTETVLPKDKTYAEVLAPAVRAAEMRQYGLAMKLCDAASRTAVKDATDLRADLQQGIADRGKASRRDLREDRRLSRRPAGRLSGVEANRQGPPHDRRGKGGHQGCRGSGQRQDDRRGNPSLPGIHGPPSAGREGQGCREESGVPDCPESDG